MVRPAIAISCFVLAACSPTEPTEYDAFAASQRLWEEREPPAYRFVFQRGGCECAPSWGLPMEVTVRGGAIESITLADGLDPDEFPTPNRNSAATIDELFALIRKALDEDADLVEVTYDREMGYPTEIRVDWFEAMADDEFVIWIRDFRPID